MPQVRDGIEHSRAFWACSQVLLQGWVAQQFCFVATHDFEALLAHCAFLLAGHILFSLRMVEITC